MGNDRTTDSLNLIPGGIYQHTAYPSAIHLYIGPAKRSGYLIFYRAKYNAWFFMDIKAVKRWYRYVNRITVSEYLYIVNTATQYNGETDIGNTSTNVKSHLSFSPVCE